MNKKNDYCVCESNSGHRFAWKIRFIKISKQSNCVSCWELKSTKKLRFFLVESLYDRCVERILCGSD